MTYRLIININIGSKLKNISERGIMEKSEIIRQKTKSRILGKIINFSLIEMI